MLGLKKLKKKKKAKKKKEQELFEAAELEKYRQEQQRKQEEGESQAEKEEAHEDSEEWKKFKLLTSGVDDILKKTQGDLDRIKSTSYFQKKPPRPKSEPEKQKTETVSKKEEATEQKKEKRWVGFEEGDTSFEPETEPQEAEPVVVEAQGSAPKEETEEEESEEEEEEDDQDDLFDTSYVDTLASGEVKLAYIPESPTEEDTGFDPFDTSIVDKVIDPKDQKKAIFSLGSAVDVLTGKQAAPPKDEPVVTSKRRRPRPQDLLLGSFEETQSTPGVSVAVEPAPKTILDDDPVFEEQTSETLGLAPVTPVNDQLASEVVPSLPDNKSILDLKTLVEEFVPLSTPVEVPPLVKPVVQEDEFDDEFAALAAESLTKKEVPKPKPPRPAPPSSAVTVEPLSDVEAEEDDPFDTSFASKVLPGKFELKQIEKEVLQEHIPIDATNIVQNKINEVLKSSDLSIKVEKKKFAETFDDDDLNLLSPSHRDLLGGSTTDLSNIGPNPIKPEAASNNQDSSSYSDPFDTSVIDVLVAPKKTELKYLEKEFLVEEKKSAQEDLEDDFDPRADEIKQTPIRPDSLGFGTNKRTSVPKIVAFDVKEPNADLLAVEQEESSKNAKPLTPYYTDSKIIEENLTSESEVDPFDTSFVTNCPGKVELKLLENELVGEGSLKRSLSDPDFNPRDENETLKKEQIVIKEERIDRDIISEDVSVDVKLHTPVTPRKFEETNSAEDIDPFDTSIVSNLVPGKEEIKFLEKEFVESSIEPINTDKVQTAVLNLLEKSKKSSIDTDLLNQTTDEDVSKPLTPLQLDSVEEDDIDPFDTSCVNNILPGKTEIKLLESELLK